MRHEYARADHRSAPLRRRQDDRDACRARGAQDSAASRYALQKPVPITSIRRSMPSQPQRRASILIPGQCRARCSTPWQRRHRTGADVFVIEGVMGLFDGANMPSGERGSTADLAAHFHLPVVLVIDVSRQAQSAAALVRGFATHDPAVHIAGVILNRIASERHSAMIAAAIAELGIRCFWRCPALSGTDAAGAPSRSRTGRRAF